MFAILLYGAWCFGLGACWVDFDFDFADCGACLILALCGFVIVCVLRGADLGCYCAAWWFVGGLFIGDCLCFGFSRVALVL